MNVFEKECLQTPAVTTNNDQVLAPIIVQPINQDIATDIINPEYPNVEQELISIQVNELLPLTELIPGEILDQQQPQAKEPIRRSTREKEKDNSG